MNELKIIDGVECYEKDGVAYLKLETVARGLGFTQEKDCVEYVRWDRIEQYLSGLGFPHKWGKDDFIPENVFYRLAMKAKNEVAEQFQAKIADEVIPSLRKTGVAAVNEDALIAQAWTILQKRVESQRAVIAKQQAQIEELTPKASYYDSILQCKDAVPVTLIAKDYGMSAKAMNKLLQSKGIQFKQGGVWHLYQKYAVNGYAQSKTALTTDKQGVEQARSYTCWTQKGRLFIYDLLKADGILPLVERSE